MKSIDPVTIFPIRERSTKPATGVRADRSPRIPLADRETFFVRSTPSLFFSKWIPHESLRKWLGARKPNCLKISDCEYVLRDWPLYRNLRPPFMANCPEFSISMMNIPAPHSLS